MTTQTSHASTVAEDQASQLRALFSAATGRDRPSDPDAPPQTRTRSARAGASAPAWPLTRSGAPSIIAIASGKGGVGKTSLCVNLAAVMAQRGRRVTLLDGDLGLANADVLCGVKVSSHLGHLLAGRRTLEEILVPAPGGFRLLPGASGLAAIAQAAEERPASLLKRLAPLERDTDVLIIDCGAGISKAVRSFLYAADAPIVVTTPEPTSITDAYAMLKLTLSDRRKQGVAARLPWLIVNNAKHEREALAVHRRIATVCERFVGEAPSLAGWAPTDQTVRNAVYTRRPFVLGDPSSRASRAVREMADHLAERLRLSAPPAKGGRGPIARLLEALRSG